MHFNANKKSFSFELFKQKKVTVVISANEIKRDCRLLARFITIIMNAHDDVVMK